MMRMSAAIVALMMILLSSGVASAALIVNATPQNVIVPLGGSNYSTITVVDTLNNSVMAVSFNINNTNITGTLSGPYLDPAFTVTTPSTTTRTGTYGQITWTGSANTKYYFKMTFTTTVPNQNFYCTISAASVNFTKLSITLNGTTIFGSSPINELATMALLGIGLLLVVVARKL